MSSTSSSCLPEHRSVIAQRRVPCGAFFFRMRHWDQRTTRKA
jgi:hypothetical protein